MRPSTILLAGIAGVLVTASILNNARDRGRGAGLEALRISAAPETANGASLTPNLVREAARSTIAIRIILPNRRPITIDCLDGGTTRDCADRIAEALSPTALAEAGD